MSIKAADFFFRDYESAVKTLQERYLPNLEAELYNLARKVVETTKNDLVIQGCDECDLSSVVVEPDMKVHLHNHYGRETIMDFHEYFQKNVRDMQSAEKIYNSIRKSFVDTVSPKTV
jgi:hypothetical protein